MDNGFPFLHRALGGIGRADVVAFLSRIEEVNTLLASGADPNEADAAGQTPLMLLVKEYALAATGRRAGLEEVMRALMTHGANPLATDRALGEAGWALGMDMVKVVIDQDSLGNKLRADDGSNVLHLLAQDNPSLLNSVLSSQFDVDKPFELPKDWAAEHRSSDGGTPIHALWCDQAITSRIRTASMEYSSYLPYAWICMSMLTTLGCDPLATNHQDISSAELVVNMVRNSGLEVVDDECPGFWETLQSLADQRTLKMSTPSSNTPARARRM